LDSLVLFAKVPALGKVKTRLAASLGEADALRVYEACLKDSLSLLQHWANAQSGDVTKRVRVYLAEPQSGPHELLQDIEVCYQKGEDLGERMQQCCDAEFEAGASKVVIIGADSPTVPSHMLRQAFSALAWHDVVLGPAFDGGYWLLGARDKTPAIFSGIEWSTNSVMTQTLANVQREQCDTALLPFWYDIDDIEDIRRVQWHSQIQSQRSDKTLHIYETVQELSL
jgi:rSAM/selenodomain-associated transferase 1